MTNTQIALKQVDLKFYICDMRIIILFLLLPILTFAQLKGKVVRIADGDTFTLLDANNNQIRIRLHGIDCPEKGQDCYQVAKDYLGKLVFQKVVYVENLDTDRYGRTIGRVWINGVDVNLALLRNGLAWHYKHYDKFKEYAEAESQARKEKLNIWSRSDAIAPWDYRRKR